MAANLYTSLLLRFKEMKEPFSLTRNADEKRKMIEHLCIGISKEYGKQAGDNLRNILEYCFIERQDPIGKLILMMERDIPMDELTAEREQLDDFDGKYGTMTSRIINQFELPEMISVTRALCTAKYTPSPVNSVRMALEALPKYEVDYRDFIFIDIGSGLGRNLLLASAHPFKKIIGVEHSEYMVEKAQRNIDVYVGQTGVTGNFELQCTDALTYDFPNEHMVLYFWWPFVEELGGSFIDRLEDICRKRPFKVILIFMSWIYDRLSRSEYFSLLDKFSTPDVCFSRNNNFQVFYFSNTAKLNQ